MTNDWGVRARRFLRRTWMKYALKGVAGADAHDRLDRAYAMEDPWNLDSEMERARFEWTNRIVAERFGALDSILEIGCGEGHQTLHLQRLCREIYGIDVSSRAIERARRRVSGARFAVADIFKHPWNDRPGKFDLVTACEIIYYVSDLDAMLERMSQLGRHCLVTVFAPAAPRVSKALTRYVGNRRDWFCYGHTVWLAGWWSND